MSTAQKPTIAIIGNQDLVNSLRLAGVRRYHIIEDEQNTEETVRKAFSAFIAEPDISIIAIQEDYVEYVEDLMAQVRQRKSLIPVIIEIPTKYGTKYPDVTQYYKSYIREFIGFDVEI